MARIKSNISEGCFLFRPFIHPFTFVRDGGKEVENQFFSTVKSAYFAGKLEVRRIGNDVIPTTGGSGKTRFQQAEAPSGPLARSLASGSPALPAQRTLSKGGGKNRPLGSHWLPSSKGRG